MNRSPRTPAELSEKPAFPADSQSPAGRCSCGYPPVARRFFNQQGREMPPRYDSEVLPAGSSSGNTTISQKPPNLASLASSKFVLAGQHLGWPRKLGNGQSGTATIPTSPPRTGTSNNARLFPFPETFPSPHQAPSGPIGEAGMKS